MFLELSQTMNKLKVLLLVSQVVTKKQSEKNINIYIHHTMMLQGGYYQKKMIKFS